MKKRMNFDDWSTYLRENSGLLPLVFDTREDFIKWAYAHYDFSDVLSVGEDSLDLFGCEEAVVYYRLMCSAFPNNKELKKKKEKAEAELREILGAIYDMAEE